MIYIFIYRGASIRRRRHGCHRALQPEQSQQTRMCLSSSEAVSLGDIFHIFSLIAFGWPHVPATVAASPRGNCLSFAGLRLCRVSSRLVSRATLQQCNLQQQLVAGATGIFIAVFA